VLLCLTKLRFLRPKTGLKDIKRKLSCEYRYKNLQQGPGTVVHSYNFSYSRGGDREDYGSRAAWAKLSRPILSNKLDVVVCPCNLSYTGSIGELRSRQKCETLSEI
jgi:hypothetical protein